MLANLQDRLNIMVSEGAFKKMTVVPLLLVFLMALVTPAAHAAGTNTLTVTAVVLSKSKCKFNTSNTALNFGALDPGNTADVIKSSSVQFVCEGSAPVAAFAFTNDDGLYESGPAANRMRHAAHDVTVFLPYTLSLSPTNGAVPKGTTQTLTITGTVSSLNYRSALAGLYSDSVVVILNP